ncbi:MAG: ABC transporter permease subunit [Spirochaetales bacterium]|nr:ABC transporter permease subunit [Spirochaetales bacterium]
MNRKLAASLVLLAGLGVVTAFPSLFTAFPKGYSDSLRSVEGTDGVEWLFAPEPPSSYYHFGTDLYGYDIKTRIVWGLRWTLAAALLVAVIRTATGAVMGIGLAMAKHGMTARDPSRTVKSLGSTGESDSGKATRPYPGAVSAGKKGFSPLSAIPGFVVAFFLLHPFTFNSPWQGWRLFLFQTAVLSCIDLAPVVATLRARTTLILAAPFIEAATATGAGRLWLLTQHVRRFIVAEIVEQFALQTVSVLQLIGRLGVFSIFMGGTIMAFDPPLLNSSTSEIAGLIGLYRLRLLGSHWMLLYPLAAYAVVLLAVRLLASGLHDRVRQKMRLYDSTTLS